ncbi:IclR family transcriptional regulator [Ramlibacter sp.]|uniref:IclR family transcriptional regulator n=1 Tax=Ramlibacter sp. TaxID=1917967 RepID=UPI003D0E1EB7
MDAVNRVFGCLEALDAAERPLSLRELQDELDCPVSTLAMTLRTLVQLGYLHHDRSRRTYAPTVLLADLGGWVASRFAPGSNVIEAATAIRNRTGGNVAIAHRNDLRLQYLHFIPGKDLEPAVRIGTTRQLCRSAMGWALMSFLTPRAIHSIVRRTNASLPSEDRVDAEPLLALVEECREAGYVLGENMHRAGYSVIAMPLKTPGMELAIGVSGRADQIKRTREKILDAMRGELVKLER